jgi:hypothetical protein
VQGPYSHLCISQRTELCPGCSAPTCCRVVAVTVEDEEMVDSARSRRCTVPASNRACDQNFHTPHFPAQFLEVFSQVCLPITTLHCCTRYSLLPCSVFSNALLVTSTNDPTL